MKGKEKYRKKEGKERKNKSNLKKCNKKKK